MSTSFRTDLKSKKTSSSFTASHFINQYQMLNPEHQRDLNELLLESSRTTAPPRLNPSSVVQRWYGKTKIGSLSAVQRREQQSLNDQQMMKLQKKWSKLYLPNVYVLNKVSNQILYLTRATFRKHLRSSTGSSGNPNRSTGHHLTRVMTMGLQ